MSENKYDSIMHEAEKTYMHQTSLNNPYAFHKAFELARRKVDRWIPVEERLPDIRDIVDIWTTKRLPDAKYEGEGWFKQNGFLYNAAQINFWRERPAPPQEDGKKV